MSTYRIEWPCCGDITETQAWEPEECPFCARPKLLPAADTITLGAIETDESAALSFTEASRKFAPGALEQTR